MSCLVNAGLCSNGFEVYLLATCGCRRPVNVMILPIASDGGWKALETQKKGPTLRLTSGQAGDLADYLGYRPTKFVVKGERVFTNGKDFIVQDRTSHIGGTWKVADSVKDLTSKLTRTATTDALLNPIGD